jgi:branched-chain amino acid aminotransferase
MFCKPKLPRSKAGLLLNMTKQFFPYAFFQGKFVKTEQAKVSVMTRALQYGMAVFSGMRGYYNSEKGILSLFKLDDHYERFLNALKILGVSIQYNKEELKDITIKLAKKNRPQTDVYFRPYAYAASCNLSPNLKEDSVFAFALYSIRLGNYLPTDKGLSVMVSSWRRPSDNAIPGRGKISGAYINSALARKDAADFGFDEAIFLTEDGHIAEGTGENLFIVRDSVLITPPETDDILEGITRRTIIQLAKDNNIPVVARRIDRSELYICDEAFFSGTACQVAWIKKVDNRVVGSGKRGPITARLQDLYFSVVHGEVERYHPWITQIKIP